MSSQERVYSLHTRNEPAFSLSFSFDEIATKVRYENSTRTALKGNNQ